jgi:hypothetical protein
MHNNGPFKLFCDDLQPCEIQADPKTFQVRTVIDWEFTHAMSSQFSLDPQWWLISTDSNMWLEQRETEGRSCMRVAW